MTAVTTTMNTETATITTVTTTKNTVSVITVTKIMKGQLETHHDPIQNVLKEFNT